MRRHVTFQNIPETLDVERITLVIYEGAYDRDMT
jgi:hypothetical protein